LDDPHPSLKIRGTSLPAFWGRYSSTGGFGDDETIIIDNWYLMETADPAIGGTVEFAVGVITGVEAIG
jgi:hypothetical protein